MKIINVNNPHSSLQLDLFFLFLVKFHYLKSLFLHQATLFNVKLLLGFRFNFLCLLICFLFDESNHVLDLKKSSR